MLAVIISRNCSNHDDDDDDDDDENDGDDDDEEDDEDDGDDERSTLVDLSRAPTWCTLEDLWPSKKL